MKLICGTKPLSPASQARLVFFDCFPQARLRLARGYILPPAGAGLLSAYFFERMDGEMRRTIGFKDFPQAWEGPLVLEFALLSHHSKTSRYRCHLESQPFDLYAPLFMLPNSNEPPTQILVALGKALGTIQTIGFRGEDKPLTVTSEICEFGFESLKVNSVRYCHYHEGQRYCLYIPNEVYANERHPVRVFLQIAVPQNP